MPDTLERDIGDIVARQRPSVDDNLARQRPSVDDLRKLPEQQVPTMLERIKIIRAQLDGFERDLIALHGASKVKIGC